MDDILSHAGCSFLGQMWSLWIGQVDIYGSYDEVHRGPPSAVSNQRTCESAGGEFIQAPRSDVAEQPMKLLMSTPVRLLGFKFPHGPTLPCQNVVYGHPRTTIGPS